ncbi:MAG: hypothetical protein JWP03_2514 [Phycisphaerales bacterium]|jgi:GH35 family endo-1,4-beta-xylanase|nr:hypothetical protein [Phycisphaerales bacterium]
MPIKFEIYRDGSRVTTFTPAGATAVGPESVPIPGEVIFKDGLLIVQRKDEHATGVSLLWDCGPLGAFQLETTRLQPREKPYNLNVELARFRLMRIMQKQEDWNLFDFPKADRFTARFGEAQSLFAEALGKLHEPAEAAKVADHALAIGLDLSEQLATFHSELLLSRRRATNGFVKHMFGCRVDPAVQNEKYKEALASNFDYCVLPMSWKQLQPQENVFNTEALDEWVELLSKRRVPTIAGPLIRLDESGVPDWMVIWEHDFDMLREMAYDFVQRVVQRYRRAVAAWNVVGGVQTNSAFTLSFEQIIELTRLLVSQVKTLLPNARTLITVTHPFGEYHARSKAGVPPMLYAEMVAQSGINFEAFALEVEMGLPKPGMFMRDLFQLSSMLDKFSTLGRPVFLTAIGCAGQATPDGGDTPEARLDPSAAGRWRKPWDAQLQADWMEAVYSMALSKPFIESVSWANLADLRQTIPGGGLLDDMLRPKPAFQRLQQMREKYKQFQKK